jgi:predicted TIM-barrel fold metal-dependent hydrolase
MPTSALAGWRPPAPRIDVRIDVHSHYNPPSYFELLQEVGAFEELSVLRLLGHLWRPGQATAETGSDADALARRLDDMDAAAIDLQVMSIGAVHPYVADPQTATTLARHVNDAYQVLVDQAPSRLAALGCQPLPHVQETVAEIARCLDDLGFAGVALGCSAGGLPLDDERFAAVWTALDDRRALVYLHPGVEIGGVIGGGDFHLAPDFVSPAEIAVAACRLMVTGHLDRYPNVKLILATLGGGIPFLARRFDRGLRQDCPARYEELGGTLRHFHRFYCDTSVVEEPAALRAARDTFGADRILLGTDYARPGARSAAAIEYVQASTDLTVAEKSAVLDGNADPLFAPFAKHHDQ